MLKNLPASKKFALILLIISIIGLMQSDYYFLCSKSKNICIQKEDGLLNFQKSKQVFKISDISNIVVQTSGHNGRKSSKHYQTIIALNNGEKIYYLNSTTNPIEAENNLKNLNNYRNSDEETYGYSKNNLFIRQLSMGGIAGAVILFFLL